MENCKIVFTFIFLNVMSLCYTDPIPDPEPDPMNLILQVSQVVKNDQCCPELDPEPRCKFGGQEYPSGHVLKQTCMELQCLSDGTWKYNRKIRSDCGNCTVFGDPHIHPFDQHTYENDDTYGYGYSYRFMGIGNYTITQPGFGHQEDFGVNSRFVRCDTDDDSQDLSCVISVSYWESGIDVEMKLPAPDNTCTNVADPNCAITVYVDGIRKTIGKSVKSFGGGNVLVFGHNHIGGDVNLLNCMNIVGSKGYSVSLCSYNLNYAFMFVFAMPSLENNIYGLCDTFNNTVQDGYTKRDRSVVQGINQTELDDFGNSWGLDNKPPGKRSTSLVEEHHHNRIKRDISVGRCIDPLVLLNITQQCQNITKPACEFMPEDWCKAINAACVFDLCLVSDHDRYAEGYSSHMQVHSYIALGGCSATELAKATAICTAQHAFDCLRIPRVMCLAKIAACVAETCG